MFMESYFGNTTFSHHINVEKSAYLLLSRQAIKKEPNLLNILVKGFHDLYPYFE